MTINTQQYSDFNAYSYDPTSAPLPPGFTRFDARDQPSGYDGTAYVNNATNEVVIVNRGTEPDDAGDRKADVDIASGRIPDQFLDALRFYDDVRAAYPDAVITTTGHSVGGCELSIRRCKQAGSGW